MKMIGADFAVQMQNASSAIAFAKKVFMEMEKRAKETFAIRIRARTVEHVYRQTPLMTVIAFWDGLDHTVKLDNIASRILARTEELVSRKKMVTSATV